MVFSSIAFLIYFLPVFLLLYFIVPNSIKNYVLLIGSIIFYSWGAPKFIFVILTTTLIDFILVGYLDRQESLRNRNLLMLSSVSLNVGLLFYFKYCNFFIENFNYVTSFIGLENLPLIEVVLPIGISFYTFETLTYVIDVYNRKHKPLNNFFNYLLYIIYFPKLIAGPIVRYHEIAEQITNRFSAFQAGMFLIGFRRFVIGLSKKVIIANQIGEIASTLFMIPTDQLSTLNAWIGMFAYTFQIYFDFSGYSDMAIGLSNMLGFKLPENFNNPYVSKSISEFWKRWHISLGTWMRNYLYIPLGGNRVESSGRLYFNLWIVFILSGFWHGAGWTFLVWGCYHGVWLILDRMGYEKILSKTPALLSISITFLTASIGWVFFNSPSINYAFNFLSRLVVVTNGSTIVHFSNTFWFSMSLAFVFSFWNTNHYFRNWQNQIFLEDLSFAKSISFTLISFLLLIYCIGNITLSNFNPFIYFRF